MEADLPLLDDPLFSRAGIYRTTFAFLRVKTLHGKVSLLIDAPPLSLLQQYRALPKSLMGRNATSKEKIRALTFKSTCLES